MIHRGPSLSESVKYWLRPDIENRIKEGSILAFFNATVARIDEDHILVQKAGGESVRLENDFVLALTGYHADFGFLQKIGVVLDPETKRPLHDPATMETSVRRVYIAGVVAGGAEGNRLFIENTRFHAKLIFQDIERKLMLSNDSEGDPSI
jgi:putative YpdA family bacillithiol system oxidoreductase